MCKILICIDNMEKLHFIINSIYKNLNNIEIYQIVSSKEKIIKELDNREADIIIFCLDNIKLLKKILEYIENNSFEKYCIFISNKKNINRIKNYEYIYEFTNADAYIGNIIKLLNEEFKNSIYCAINEELYNLKFNLNQCGTKYLAESILEIYNINDYDNINLTQNIYPIIAQKYNKSVNNIKTNITKAYLNMFDHCSKEYLEYYLKLSIIENKKTKTNDLILGVIRHIS